jgi:type IV secretory pathway TrbF-like protein
LVFHSLRSIPRYIYELSNYITIFKTNDTPYLSAKELKDERIEEIMERVKNSKNIHINVTLKIY